MFKLITLTAIDLNSERAIENHAHYAAQPPAPVEPDLDDLERPLAPATPAEPAPAPELKTYPIHVNVAMIREFYARKHGKTGTRIVLGNGAAQIVQETVDEVMAKINSLNN